MRPSLRRLEKANEELYRPMRLRGNTSYPLLSDAKGQAHFHLSFRRGHIHPAEAEVLYTFTDLVRSPIRHGVGKCDRCSRYYVGERSYTPKRYCGRVCSVPATAEKATRERRGRVHEEKLMTIRKSGWQPEIAARYSPEQWKQRLAAKTMVTVKWVTRALNRGEIAFPQQSED